MVDEKTDSSNWEKFIICIRLVDKNWNVHEDFIGLYKLTNIKSGTLVASTEDILQYLCQMSGDNAMMVPKNVWK